MASISDVEIQARLDEAKVWVAKVTKQQLSGSFDVVLKNGVALCNAINVVAPGAIPKINDYNSAFRQIENINYFIQAAQIFGVDRRYLFEAEDLFEKKNLVKVYVTLQALATILVDADLPVPPLEDDEIESIRQLAFDIDVENSLGAKKDKPSQLSVFEQTQSRSQKLASSAQPYRASNLIRTEQGAGAQNAISFSDAQVLQAQKMASSAMTANNSIVKSGDKPIGGLSFSEQQQLNAQRLAFGASGNNNNIVRSEHGAGTGGLSLTDSKHLEAQKLASSEFTGGHGIVRTTEGAGTGGLSYTDSKQLEAQKLASERFTGGNNIVRTTEGAGTGGLNFTDSRMVESQKIISENKLASDNIIR